jgi:hypothetical protein
MKKTALVVLLFAGVVSTALTIDGAPLRRQNQQRQQRLQNIRPAVRRSVAEDAVYAFYARQFQQAVEVRGEVLSKVLSFVDGFVHDRFELTQRRTRALNQLRQAVRGGATDEEYSRRVQEFDSADAEFQANQERFLKNVDPLLTPRQQAVVRMVQIMADNRIREALETVQNPNQQRPNAPSAATTPD